VSRTCRVLVVDESPYLGDVLASALEREACHVAVARTPAHALQLASSSLPDVIIVDLAQRSECDLLARLSGDRALSRVPVVLISTDPVAARRRSGERVSRVFGKPFYMSEVVAAVLETVGWPAHP
jgi:DNA-binding response OmpR family regulator